MRDRRRIAKQIKVMSIEAEVPTPSADAIGRLPRHTVIRRLASSSLLRHNVLLFTAQTITSVFSYLFHPVVGHLLGPKGYGTIGSLMALGAVLLIPGQILIYIANKFAADLVAQGRLDQVNYLLRRATWVALLIGVLTAIAFIGLSPVLASFLTLPSPQLVMLASLGFILSYAAPLTSGIIQGRQQFRWFALLNFLTAFLRLVTVAIVLLMGFGVQGVLLVGFLNGCVVYAISFVPLRDVLQATQARVPTFRPLLTYSFGATLALGAGTLLTNTDILLAKHFLSPTDAGYYAALAKMGQTVLFIGGSLVWVMFPKVAALQQQGCPHRAVLAWTMLGVLALSAVALFLFWLFPGQIITLIFHAPVQVARQLFWYGLAMLLLALANVLMYYYLSLGQMAFVPILLVCCVVQAALIVAWHSSVGQIVTAMVAVMAILACGLAGLYLVQLARTTRKNNLPWLA